jgi:actin-related protein
MNLDKPTVVIDNVIGFLTLGKWKLEIRIQRIIKKTSRYTFSVSCIISSIGRPKYQVVIPSTSNQSDAYMGDDLNSSKRGMFKLRYPIKHGVIENWDDM